MAPNARNYYAYKHVSRSLIETLTQFVYKLAGAVVGSIKQIPMGHIKNHDNEQIQSYLRVPNVRY